MRARILLALLMVAGALFAGCSDDDDGDDGDATTTPPRTDTPNPSNMTTAPPRPNEKPVLALKVTADGNDTNVTTVGGNVTFDGSASTDPDGRLTDLAVIVTDSNQTRFDQLLRNGQFQPVTFRFDRPGVVIVVLNGIDDRGGTATLVSKVFVNHPQALGSHQFNGGLAGGVDAGCDGPVSGGGAGSNPVDPTYYRQFTFDVRAGATFVEADVATENPADAAQGQVVSMVLCAPDGTPISDIGTSGTPIMSTAGTAFTESLDYYLAVLSRAPQTTAMPSVTVHYEPQAAAPAA